ncbi:unnamed protein product [Mytilus coruscus]|uniref:Uncharacterized protein n=1 Tax=Mytilus coruscus TaxID=42192 RepID=A0A6J8CR73_MYTCO|nr:unnamed protein product [Mytilus coruscus]
MYDYENLLRLKLPLNRKSTCTNKPNAYGHKLLDFCRKNNVYIINGRAGKDRFLGERTCKDLTTTDYCLCSSNLLSCESEFEINEYSPIFSDVHRQLHLTLNCREASKSSDEVNLLAKNDNNRSRRWIAEKCDEFVNNLVEDDMFFELNFMIEELDSQSSPNTEIDTANINSVVDKICLLFNKTTKNTFGIIRPNKKFNNRNVHRPWFDKTCEEKRRLFHKARKSYNRFKNEANRTCLSVASRNYKSAMDTSFKQYQDKITSDLRTSSKSDTKKFWNILNRCTEKSGQSIKK